MNENTAMDAGFDDFMGAFEDGYQTDNSNATTEPESQEESNEAVTTQETEEAPESSETDSNDTAESKETSPSEGEPEPEKKDSEPKFTIRVNKENREVTLNEMTTLAQKGANYDKVKERLDESNAAYQALQQQVNANAEAMEMLEEISKGAGKPIPELIETLYLNYQKSNGVSESEAKLRLENARVKKQLENYQAEQRAKTEQANSANERAQREVKEFKENYPDVELTEELCNSLMADVRNGMTLTAAYQKAEIARLEKALADQEKKRAADEQNKKNKAKSPGPLADSGGKKTHSDFDDFMAAYNK